MAGGKECFQRIQESNEWGREGEAEGGPVDGAGACLPVCRAGQGRDCRRSAPRPILLFIRCFPEFVGSISAFDWRAPQATLPGPMDRKPMAEMRATVETLALASFVWEDERYAEPAARMVSRRGHPDESSSGVLTAHTGDLRGTRDWDL